LARPFADFLIGRSIAQPLFEQLYAIVKEDAAIEQILSLRAMYSGPEEVVVMAKVHPQRRAWRHGFGGRGRPSLA